MSKKEQKILKIAKKSLDPTILVSKPSTSSQGSGEKKPKPSSTSQSNGKEAKKPTPTKSPQSK